MIEWLPRSANSSLVVLCIGAHCDDIEIGCGATIKGLLLSRQDVKIYWLVLSASEIREKEARTSAGHFVEGASHRTIDIQYFKNGYFPYAAATSKITSRN